MVEARRRGIARGLLFGDRERLEDRLWKLEEDPSHHEIVHEPDDRRAASLAVERVRAGEASLLLKGRLPTGDLLRAVLDRDHGLRTGRILSDVMVSEHPTAPPRRIVGITDGGVNVAPRLAEKQAILENAVRVFHRLGLRRARSWRCSARWRPRPRPCPTPRTPARSWRWPSGARSTGCHVVGPLALDNALLPWAARAKGIDHPLAGRADVLLVPTIEAGNILGKAFSWLAGKPVAHVIEGARAPVLIPSRVERADDKLLSIALGVALGRGGRVSAAGPLVLAVNPGAGSTKLGLFRGESLARRGGAAPRPRGASRSPRMADQLPMRLAAVREFLAARGARGAARRGGGARRAARAGAGRARCGPRRRWRTSCCAARAASTPPTWACPSRSPSPPTTAARPSPSTR